jgi:hypothetical protein
MTFTNPSDEHGVEVSEFVSEKVCTPYGESLPGSGPKMHRWGFKGRAAT